MNEGLRGSEGDSNHKQDRLVDRAEGEILRSVRTYDPKKYLKARRRFPFAMFFYPALAAYAIFLAFWAAAPWNYLFVIGAALAGFSFGWEAKHFQGIWTREAIVRLLRRSGAVERLDVVPGPGVGGAPRDEARSPRAEIPE